MTDIPGFIGRFHPVLVHLPIGILLMAVLFQLVSWRTRNSVFAKALEFCLLIGSIGAVLSCITGFLLSDTADYDEQTVWWHQWLGISVAVISLAWFIALRYTSPVPKQAVVSPHSVQLSGASAHKPSPRAGFFISILLAVLISITGHLGGTLTHGEGYLSITGADDTTTVIRKPIADVQEAVVYADIVQPVLARSCYSCHGTKKQKGKLRLDDHASMLKGGKNGAILDAAAPSESEMVRRLLLPFSDKKHMPPKDKPQLSPEELALLHWWVEAGFPFDKKVKDLPQTDKTKPALLSLSGPVKQVSASLPVIPSAAVAKADQTAVQALIDRGAVVLPVTSESNYLSVNFVMNEKATDGDMRLLVPVAKQLLFLKAGDTKITDSALQVIAQCKNLVRLQLEHTAVSDSGIALLTNLDRLQDLNLVGTGVTAAGLLKLKHLKSMRNIYLYQSKVAGEQWKQLREAFPSAGLDSGGYRLPMLEGDTSMIKPKPKAEKKK